MGRNWSLRLTSGGEEAALEGAREFVARAREAISHRGRFLVSLSGGRTPRRLYELLAKSPLQNQVDWANVHVFFGDERTVPPDHEQSNFRMASESLLKHVPIPESQIHRMPGEAPESISSYQQVLARYSYGASPPRLDLILLGIGTDGHTASLFPGTKGIEVTDRWVVANEVPQLNTTRLTMTFPILNLARHALLLAVDEDKQKIMPAVWEGPVRYPVQSVESMLWITDERASAQVTHPSFVKAREAGPVRLKLAPSILAADFRRLEAHAQEAVEAGADRLHLDVMDGHFVPNISFGPLVVEALRPSIKIPLECHLMISNPDDYIQAFASSGADSILVHVEGNPHLNRTIQRIRAEGKRAGVVLNPSTPASALREVLTDVDLILAMTVNPGFGGQKFIESTLPKIRELRDLIDRHHPGCELEVDGGVDAKTAPLAIAAGARVLVAGSSVFRNPVGVQEASRQILSSL